MREFIVSIVWLKHTDNNGRNIQNSLHRVNAVSSAEAQGISLNEYKSKLPDHCMFLIQSMEVIK